MARIMTASMGGAALALLLATAATADEPPIRAPVVQAVVDCRKIEDGAARLACYDAAVAALATAEARGDVVSIDREQGRAVRRQAFGFALPTLAFLDGGEKPEDLNRITETVASAFHNADGKWV